MSKIGESILVLVISIILIAPGLNKIGTFLFAYTKSNTYTGVVVKEGVGRFTGCKPFIEYLDREGNLVEFKSEINYHFFFCPKKGAQIKLITSKHTPSKTYTVNMVHYIIIPVILIVLGFGILFAYFIKKAKDRNVNHNQLFERTH